MKDTCLWGTYVFIMMFVTPLLFTVYPCSVCAGAPVLYVDLKPMPYFRSNLILPSRIVQIQIRERPLDILVTIHVNRRPCLFILTTSNTSDVLVVERHNQYYSIYMTINIIKSRPVKTSWVNSTPYGYDDTRSSHSVGPRQAAEGI